MLVIGIKNMAIVQGSGSNLGQSSHARGAQDVLKTEVV